MDGEIAIVGSGLVGRAWAIVFARAGRRVRLYDAEAAVLETARDRISQGLADLKRFGLIDNPDGVLARIRVERDLKAALAGAAYIQESVFERVDVNRKIMAEIDAVIGPETIVGSSSSGIPDS